MNQAALFCDGTESYVIPPEPEMNSKVTIRFRTAKNDRVKVFLLSKGEGQEIEDSQEMEKECTEREFDYYSIRRELGEEPFRYFFMIQDEEDGSVCYYNRCGVSRRSRSIMTLRSFGILYAGLGQGRGHVSDLYGPVLQRRPVQ